ncbi:MAG: hypothetical protein H6815_03350 [Phycisphaeraceae bacterium]|nr:hypothetical protein [Phycisphaerales bacterium]MCB9859464.1 hypothetical protein [Phycisphaeraceae bacterium]
MPDDEPRPVGFTATLPEPGTHSNQAKDLQQIHKLHLLSVTPHDLTFTHWTPRQDEYLPLSRRLAMLQRWLN